ncbi:MAG: HNH endonuclease [Candidatus Promineifilaceae bacterium]
MTTTLNQYLDRFSHLHTDKNRKTWTAVTTFRAPHKPLLLLAVLDLFAQGSITANLIPLTPELSELFTLYWHKVRPPSQRGNLTYPFYYLKSEGFWHLQPRPGQETALAVYRPNAGLNALQTLILGASLDEALYALLCTAEARQHLRAALINTYFAPDLHPVLVEQSAMNAAAFQYSQELLQQAKSETFIRETAVEDKPFRDQGFRRAIVKAYDHRCALCGVRILTADGHTAVAAAHIIPWSESHNDDPRNGLALCHLCHWTFDEGLVAFTDTYKVKISPQLPNSPNLPGHLLTFTDRRLIGPGEAYLWPFVDSIRWHRKERFRAR